MPCSAGSTIRRRSRCTFPVRNSGMKIIPSTGSGGKPARIRLVLHAAAAGTVRAGTFRLAGRQRRSAADQLRLVGESRGGRGRGVPGVLPRVFPDSAPEFPEALRRKRPGRRAPERRNRLAGQPVRVSGDGFALRCDPVPADRLRYGRNGDAGTGVRFRTYWEVVIAPDGSTYDALC